MKHLYTRVHPNVSYLLLPPLLIYVVHCLGNGRYREQCPVDHSREILFICLSVCPHFPLRGSLRPAQRLVQAGSGSPEAGSGLPEAGSGLPEAD